MRLPCKQGYALRPPMRQFQVLLAGWEYSNYPFNGVQNICWHSIQDRGRARLLRWHSVPSAISRNEIVLTAPLKPESVQPEQNFGELLQREAWTDCEA